MHDALASSRNDIHEARLRQNRICRLHITRRQIDEIDRQIDAQRNRPVARRDDDEEIGVSKLASREREQSTYIDHRQDLSTQIQQPFDDFGCLWQRREFYRAHHFPDVTRPNAKPFVANFEYQNFQLIAPLR